MARPMQVFAGVVLTLSCAGYAATSLVQASTATGTPPGPVASPSPAAGTGSAGAGDPDFVACPSPGEDCADFVARLRRQPAADDDTRTATAVLCKDP